MEQLKLYIVTKSSSDHTFEVGNVIYLDDNGSLVDCTHGGWLEYDEWNQAETNDFEYEIHPTHYLDVFGKDKTVRPRVENMNVYRVWFDADNERCGTCCVLVSARTKQKAIELAKYQVRDFPELLNAQYSIMKFDIDEEHASIC